MTASLLKKTTPPPSLSRCNNNITLTRDKLPDFTHLASSIKDTEEKSAESKKNDSSKADSKAKKENTSKAE